MTSDDLLGSVVLYPHSEIPARQDASQPADTTDGRYQGYHGNFLAALVVDQQLTHEHFIL